MKSHKCFFLSFNQGSVSKSQLTNIPSKDELLAKRNKQTNKQRTNKEQMKSNEKDFREKIQRALKHAVSLPISVVRFVRVEHCGWAKMLLDGMRRALMIDSPPSSSWLVEWVACHGQASAHLLFPFGIEGRREGCWKETSEHTHIYTHRHTDNVTSMSKLLHCTRDHCRRHTVNTIITKKDLQPIRKMIFISDINQTQKHKNKPHIWPLF